VATQRTNVWMAFKLIPPRYDASWPTALATSQCCDLPRRSRTGAGHGEAPTRGFEEIELTTLLGLTCFVDAQHKSLAPGRRCP